MDGMSHLSSTCVRQAVCFLRPTRENCARIRRELREPRYGQYFLCEPSPTQPCTYVNAVPLLTAAAGLQARMPYCHTTLRMAHAMLRYHGRVVMAAVYMLDAVFSNRLEDLRISELAEEDRKELVSGVQV